MCFIYDGHLDQHTLDVIRGYDGIVDTHDKYIYIPFEWCAMFVVHLRCLEVL